MSPDPVKQIAYDSFKALVGVYNNKKPVSVGRTEVALKSGKYDWVQDPAQKVSGLDAPAFTGLWHDIITGDATYKLFADALPKISDKYALLQAGLSGLGKYVEFTGYGPYHSVSRKMTIKDEAGAQAFISTMVDDFYKLSAAAPATPVAPQPAPVAAIPAPVQPAAPAVAAPTVAPVSPATVVAAQPVVATPAAPAASTAVTPAPVQPAPATAPATAAPTEVQPTFNPVAAAPVTPIEPLTLPTPEPTAVALIPDAQPTSEGAKSDGTKKSGVDEAIGNLEDLFE